MLIPLDDRTALLALKDFDRRARREEARDGHDDQLPARRRAA
jgi:hypothetical protein